jgi:hypothetical protein
MSIAEKSLLLKKDFDEVAKAGQLKPIADSECLNSALFGNPVAANDVVSIEHNVPCNLESKNLFSYKFPSGTFYGMRVPLDLPIGTYTFSARPIGELTENAYLLIEKKPTGVETYATIARPIDAKTYKSSSFNVEPGYEYDMYLYCGVADYLQSTFDNFQIELGSVATAYTPYISDFSSVEVTRYGKNLLDMSKFIGKTISNYGGTLIFNEDGSVTGSGTPTGYVSSAVSDKLYLPRGVYRFSMSGVSTNIAGNVSIYDTSGTLLESTGVMAGSKSRTIDLTNTTKYPDFSYLVYSFKRSSNNVELSGTAYFQLELGSTTTEYEFALRPVVYQANADGTVDGMTSIAPNVTLLTDTEGVVINANYYKDPDIVVSNLQQSIALSGGV